MRTPTTSSQTQALASMKDLSTHLRVSVDDGSGNYQDLTDLEGYNWVDSVTYSEASGQPTATAKVKLKREAHKLSLSPFMDGSKLNVGGAVIDIARKILIETAVLPRGKQPATDEWEEVFHGYIEKIALAKSPIVLSCQDLGSELLGRFIETQRVYAAAASDNALNEVIQDIVDDNDPNLATVAAQFTWPAAGVGTPIVVAATGADTSEVIVGDYFGYSRSPLFLVSAINPNVSVTVVNPAGRLSLAGAVAGSSIMIPAADRITLQIEGAAPAWAIHEYYQSKDRVLTALRKLAQQIGYEVSYRWNTGTSAFELTLWTPDRAAVTPDVIIGPGVFKNIQKFDQDRSKIRNVIKITAMVAGVRTTTTRTGAASVAKYGRRYMEATEKSSSQIDTVAEMNDFGDVILGDLEEPEADLAGVLPYRWDIQPADYARFEADGTRFDTDQDMGIVSLKHVIPNKGEAKTVAAVRGKPGGGVNRWLELEGMPGVALPVDLKSDAAADNPAATAGLASIIVEYDNPRTMTPPVDDWAYTNVYTHTADPGAPPSSAYFVIATRSTRVEIGGLVPGTLYHTRLEFVDDAGNIGGYSADVQVATQRVGAYHENPDRIRDNLVPNGEFCQTTLDVTTDPPDSWDPQDNVTPPTGSPADWGAADEVYIDTTQLLTGYHSVKILDAAGAGTQVVGGFIPVPEDTLFSVAAVLRASSIVSGGVKVRLYGYSLDKTYLGFTNLLNAELAAANTWELYRYHDYWGSLFMAATPVRFIRLAFIKTGAGAYSVWCDRVVMLHAKQTFLAYRAAAKVVNTATYERDIADTEVFDVGGANIGGTDYGYDDIAADGTYRIMEPGEYRFEVGAGLAALSNAKKIEVGFYLNGVQYTIGDSKAVGAAGEAHAVGSVTMSLVKDDFVKPYVWHNEGGNLNLVVGAVNTWFSGGRVE